MGKRREERAHPSLNIGSTDVGDVCGVEEDAGWGVEEGWRIGQGEIVCYGRHVGGYEGDGAVLEGEV